MTKVEALVITVPNMCMQFQIMAEFHLHPTIVK